jgi:hypothetical protein
MLWLGFYYHHLQTDIYYVDHNQIKKKKVVEVVNVT